MAILKPFRYILCEFGKAGIHSEETYTTHGDAYEAAFIACGPAQEILIIENRED